MEKSKKINVRSFVSVSLLFLIILFITAVVIQILDAIIDPKILIEIYQNPENQYKYFLVEVLHIIRAIHVVSGFLFVGLSIIHIIKNWKILKGYIKKSK
jgi:hypothetical protein